MMPPRLAWPLAIAALAGVALAGPRMASARAIRPIFEPTDLEMEGAGVVELDVQLGAIRSRGPWRVVLPDFELDIGILPYLELDLDGAYAIEGPSSGPFTFDHAAPDSLWPSLKLGFFDSHDDDVDRAWALGMQIGPKIPVAPSSHGIGVEGLLLVGYAIGPLHLVLNAGAFVDPSPDATSSRPVGVETGLDFEFELGNSNRHSVIAEISGVHFLSDDPDQLLATAGYKWAALPWFELSLIGLWGFLDGSDRYGLLLGMSPKLHLF